MGHFHEGYRLKCSSPRTHINVPNSSPTGSQGEKDQMEVVVSPPPVSSSYPLTRFPESPPGIHPIMYTPHPIVDSAIHNSQCHVQIKTEQEAVNYSNRNVSINRNFRCSRKESYPSPRLVTNGSRVPQDYTLPAKLGTDRAFNMSPSEKENGLMNVSGGNSDSYFIGKVLESSMENLMKFAEVLYKCTLCTTLPSILTSRDSFISHVNDLHLTKKQSHKECQHCDLKFSTEEDLRAHCRLSHSIEAHPGDEVEATEPSPIDEFTNKSEIEISTENQCTVSDPTKSIQNRTSRFIMDSAHSKQRHAPTVSSRTLIRVAKRCSPGKEMIKPEKIPMDENISRLQQLADQILISNTRLTGTTGGAAGSPSGFFGPTANPSYTPDFGKYTKLIREGGNIVYFCQVCNCKCQARAAFMSHCSSYQHRARIEAADRSNTDHVQQSQSQPQTANSQSTQPPPPPPPPPPPAHSHPHSQRHQANSHQPYPQQSRPLQLSQPNFKRDHLSSSSSTSLSQNIINCSITNSNVNPIDTASNNNSIYSTSGTSSNNKYLGQSSSSSVTSTASLTIPTSMSTSANTHSPSSNPITHRNSSAPPSPVTVSETSQNSRTCPEENCSDAASPKAAGTPPSDGSATNKSLTATTTPVAPLSPKGHLHEDSDTLAGSTVEAASCTSGSAALDRNSQRRRHRADGSSDGDSNCDKEVTSRQRRKRHAPVAVRHPQVTTSWSDSESEDERVGMKSRKMSIEAGSGDDNDNNNGDDDVDHTTTNSNNTGSSRSSSSSDSSRKSSPSSTKNTDTSSSNNDSNNTAQSSGDTTTNTKNDAKQKQTDDTSEKEELNTQPEGSPDTDQKSSQSPRSSPIPTRVPTPSSSPEQTNETPIDFSMTDPNCESLPPQNIDSLGVLSSVVEGFLVSKDQAPVAAAATTLVSIKTEPEDSETSGLRGIYRCSFCEFVCYDIRDYEEHFIKEHDPDLLDVTLTDSSGKTVHGEYWKMLKIKDILPELLVGCAKGYVSRDILLQKISLLLNIPEVVHWGPACNKAVREEFPNSLAQRKGKFKKTYYFGVALIEQLQEQDELSDSENVTYQPLRDLAQDLEKILQFLPELVFWTGDLDVGISRDEVLQLLGEKIEETGVQYWGVQCNRAMRFLFPSIHMKRKGKFKTTVYFGVDFMKNITRPQKFDNDQTLFIKSEPLDDSYETAEPKTHHSEMSCAIFPTNIPVPTSPSPTSTTATTRSYAAAIE